MASRVFLCLTAACCCITLLSPPAHGRRLPAGLRQAAGGGFGGGRGRLLHQLRPVPEPLLVPTEVVDEERRGVPVATTKQARRPPPAAWSVERPELRAVPGGPDPLHHHGGSPSRRPEQEHRTPSP